jgi:DNA-binding transcriptional LysR family regulator
MRILALDGDEHQSIDCMAPMPHGDGHLPRQELMRLPAIDANLLLALHALLQETNVTRAAKRLGIGQPGMSRSLARLREHFKDPLLVPKGRGLVLSPTALALVGPVERASAALADVFEGRGDDSGGLHRAFTLASADLFAASIVPGLLAEMRAGAPDATLEVRSLPARSTEQILGDGADVALGAFEDVPPTVSQRHLFSDAFVCLVRADHPRVQSGAMSLKTYLELRHLEVLPAPNARPGLRIARALGSKAEQRRVVARVPYFALAARILSQSDLVLTMTRSWAEALRDFGPLRIVALPVRLPPQRFSQIWLRRHDTDAAHTWFRELVAKVCMRRFGESL